MLKYRCLVLDHDDTVVQSMKTMSYPFWCMELEIFRPGQAMTFEEYVLECHHRGFAGLCQDCFHFTDEELKKEHAMWMEYVMTHTPDPYPGIAEIIHRQKAESGLVCVVSHSHADNILRDYRTHFGMEPDAVYGWELPPQQRKPNAYPLLDIMERYKLEPKDLLVVDDMKLAWKMAHPLGVKIVFAAWGKIDFPELSAEMTSLCDFSFSTTEELAEFLFN